MSSNKPSRPRSSAAPARPGSSHRSGPGPRPGPGASSPGAASRPGPRGSHAAPAAKPPLAKPQIQPLSEAELDQLQALLDQVPAPLEPLDVSMLDGYLVGVLLQPKAVPAFQWTRHVLDSEEGRSPPERFDSRPLLALVKRRYQQLNQAIVDRQWFDPWVFEMQGEDEDEEAEPSEVVFPWVAGFALATELFPELMREDAADLLEPLAALFMHLDPDDLEDADDLLEEIESLEPPKDLEEAVEGLVSACLMLADVSRPQAKPAAPQRPPARRGPPPRSRY
ncbi:YecA/YgfB family protein [Kinneretia aquatilis]|uniref:YecA/YgfB family protein n=1 Tax=Kinneretia aquatilis TaxID=2070761 RepID=UPI00105744FA|nr:YecA family protein [Paucibacter aquatile]